MTKRAFVKTCRLDLQVFLLREKPEESPVAATIVESAQLLRSRFSFKLSDNLDEIVELEDSWCMERVSVFILVIDNVVRASASVVVSRLEACGVDHGAHELRGAVAALKQPESHFRKRRGLLPDTPSAAAMADAT